MSTKHIHKYIFPSPDGPTSIGKCDCGATQEGFNSMDSNFKFNNKGLTGKQRRNKALKNFVKR
mgnify:FL=1|jgi:hypothetical protein